VAKDQECCLLVVMAQFCPALAIHQGAMLSGREVAVAS
jgi:hypothetical protein